MISSGRRSIFFVTVLMQASLAVLLQPAAGQVAFGPEQLVQAAGTDIDVPGYSVPRFAHWDNDGLEDLVVGEGSGSYAGRVRIYLNVGTASAPQFSTYFHAQSEGSDLVVPGSG